MERGDGEDEQYGLGGTNGFELYYDKLDDENLGFVKECEISSNE